MTKRLLLFFILIGSIQSNAQTFRNYLKNESYVFNDTNKIHLTDLFTTHKAEFGLETYDAMVLDGQSYVKLDTNDIVDRGSLQERYKQYYKGYLVEGKLMNVLSKCGIALVVNGSVITGLDIDVEDTITQGDALDSALNYTHSSFGYLWEDSAHENGIKEDAETYEDSTATYFPKGKLVISKKIWLF